jgi:type IV secretory pathway TraG/TraD family ATPase VirD4
VKYSDFGKGILRASRSVARSAGNAASAGSQQLAMRRAATAAAGGVLGPGDSDPPPASSVDFYDYRGVAVYRDIVTMSDGPFSLGRYLDPRKGPQKPLGLPLEVLMRHAAVIGPTGSGKTKSILVPWIATALRQGHCVVAIDIGGDLLDDLLVHRAATGPFGAKVSKWDFTEAARSISWPWLSALDDDEAIVAAVDAIHGRLQPNDSQPYFHQRDARILRGLIEIARETGQAATAGELLRLLRDGSRLQQIVLNRPNLRGSTRLKDIVGKPGGDYMQVVSGVINDLEILDTPGMEKITGGSGLDLAHFFDEPQLLIIGAPIHGGRISEASSGLLLSQVIHRLYRRFTTSSGCHAFLVIDEAARLRTRIPFEELLSVARRARVTVVLATQDVGQFADDHERIAILGNCATYISLPSRSKANGDYLAGRLGTRFQSSVSLTRNPSNHQSGGGLSSTRSLLQVPVLGGREILDPPWGERAAVVHSQPLSGKPFLVDLSRPEFAT